MNTCIKCSEPVRTVETEDWALIQIEPKQDDEHGTVALVFVAGRQVAVVNRETFLGERIPDSTPRYRLHACRSGA